MRNANCTFKFRANYTDGSRGLVRGMSTCDSRRSVDMAKQIARRENVQSVKILTIPNNK